MKEDLFDDFVGVLKIKRITSFKFQSLLVIGTICAFDHVQNIYKS